MHEGNASEPEAREGKPPEGFGPMPQEALVRAAVIDALTGARASRLVSREGREALKKRMLRAIEATADVNACDVFFPDLTVQYVVVDAVEVHRVRAFEGRVYVLEVHEDAVARSAPDEKPLESLVAAATAGRGAACG